MAITISGDSPNLSSATIAIPTITSLYGQNSNLVTTPYRDAGLIPAELIYRLNTAYVGSSTTSAQSLFGVGVTVSGSTVYQFEAMILISKTATATTHNLSTLFAGTATVNNIAYTAIYSNNSAYNSAASIANATYTGITQTTAATVGIGLASAGQYVEIALQGTISINASGTLIPQYQTSAAVGPYSTNIGSYFKLSPMSASGSNTSIGTWT